MGLIADIVGFFGKQADQQIETKEAPQVLINYTSNSYSKRQSFREIADDGYQQNAVVYRCVNEIAYGAASIDFKVFQGDDQLTEHPLINLLNRPNPLQVRRIFPIAVPSFYSAATATVTLILIKPYKNCIFCAQIGLRSCQVIPAFPLDTSTKSMAR